MKGEEAYVTIDYVLKAVITPKVGEPITLSQSLNVKRAIQPPDTPRNSIRIFPPTNLTANCHLPAVIHPIGETTVSMRMDGIVKRNTETKTQTQWRLKRLTWRLDEMHKSISPACPKHLAKLGEVDDVKKGIQRQDTRVIGSAEIKTGWKSDYSSPDGTIELEFPMSIDSHIKPFCDMKSKDGTEVSHALVVEMIVAEEWAPIKKPGQVTPTGAARVLRMHFQTTVTERAGLGISWDEEQPPLYENVPASPPGYRSGAVDEMSLIDYEDLEALDNNTPRGTPRLGPVADNGEAPSVPGSGTENINLRASTRTH